MYHERTECRLEHRVPVCGMRAALAAGSWCMRYEREGGGAVYDAVQLYGYQARLHSAQLMFKTRSAYHSHQHVTRYS
jgi:hypothetical protein